MMFADTAPTAIYTFGPTLALHDALPISCHSAGRPCRPRSRHMATVAMNRRVPLVTENSQTYTFARRALVLGGLQGGIAALLAGRMAWLSIAATERYKYLSR